MKRVGIGFLAALALALLPLPAQAGCCTVVSLDTLPPQQVTPNEPTVISFTVRFRNKPVEGLAPVVRAESLTGEGPVFQAFTALPTGTPGQYVAVLDLPAAGTWDWQIHAPDTGSSPAGKLVLPSLIAVDAASVAAVVQEQANVPASGMLAASSPWLWVAWGSGAASTVAFLLALAVLLGRRPARALAVERAR